MPSHVIDLTQPLGPDTVLWPGSTPFAAEVRADPRTSGSYARDLRLPEHSGTHLDAPSHFAPGGIHAGDIPPARLVGTCAVIDVRKFCRNDPAFTLEREHVEEVERRDGPIEPGSAVLLWTGWEDRRGDPDLYLGGPTEVDLAFPGFGLSGAETLLERDAVGLGIDTLGIDPGHAHDFPVHHLTLGAGLWHLEGLVNLGALPPRGATLVVGALRLVEGSGTPARVFALLPAGQGTNSP
ncbi:MAG: cyclase family protein [Solirubrobacterales bacterium]